MKKNALSLEACLFNFQTGSFQKQLLPWFKKNKRDLPFRRTTDPYKIWLSEIMLQQTTVGIVLDYYSKFLKRFPNIQSVAVADEEELLKFWQGLGYYSRVRHFQHACRQVIHQHGGKIPHSFEELKKLKGVGDYTAAAIASICFNEPQAAVDGNVKRVLARLLHVTQDSGSPQAKMFFASAAQKLLDRRLPGDFNQAMMELGATVCKPRPHCGECPVQSHCASYGKNPQDLPKKIRQKFIQKTHAALVIHNGNRLILKAPHPKNLIANMWELPFIYDFKPADTGTIRHKFFIDPRQLVPRGQVSHAITNKKITALVFELKMSPLRLTKPLWGGFKILRRESLREIPLNTLSQKVIKKYFAGLLT